MYVILIVFPLSMGTIYGTVNFFCGWQWLYEGHNREFYYLQEFTHKGLAALAVIMVFAAIGITIRACDLHYRSYADKATPEKAWFATAAAVFLMCIMIRMVLFLVYKGEIQPFSDFKSAWDRANGEMASLPYGRFFPGYINYSLLEKAISHLAGASYDAVLCFGIFCNGITAAFAFLTAGKIFKRYELSLLASVLYLLNPSSIVYALTSTPEHMAIACFAGSIYFICKYLDAQKLSDKIIFLIAAGAIGGVGNSIKTFFPIIVIASAITFLLGMPRRSDARKLRALLCLCLSVVVMFLAQKTITNGITSVSEQVFNVELDFADATPNYFEAGLNREGEGQIHIGGLSGLYIRDRMNGMPLNEARISAAERVINDWREHINELPEFFCKKTIWGWQDNHIPLEYFLKELGIDCDTFLEQMVYKWIASVGVTFNQIWYIFSMLLGVIGVIFIIRNNMDVQNLKLTLSNLIILGYFCLIIFSESQSRYKCLILPFLCITDAYAAVKIYEVIQSRWIKRADRKRDVKFPI